MLAKKFTNTMRYIDTKIILFHSAISDIPCELQPKKTTECGTTVVLRFTGNYRNIKQHYMTSEVFLNFSIVTFPYLSSNIPSGPAYGVYVSQLVRIGRICSNYTDFAVRHYKLTQRLVRQGFRYSTLCVVFQRFAKKRVVF